jgi:peptidoglycan hydrolase-like protein with peptidoglycan-binding domain/surface antigen
MSILPEYSAARRTARRAGCAPWASSRKGPAGAWSPTVRAGVAFVMSLALLGGCTLPESFQLPWDASTREAGPQAEGVARSSAERKQDRALVQRTQRLLNDLGYKAGPADGVAGPKTREAVRAYQRKSGLPADGKASAALLRRLEASQRTAEALSGAPLGDPPLYEAGSTYVYSDGRVDTVVGLKGDTVRWQRNDGTKFTTYRNFLLPRVYWQSEDESGKWTVDGKPWTLWPRSSGEEIAFSATAVVQQAGGTGGLTRSTEDWRCRFAGRKRVTVIAGTFDTVKLVCQRAGGESAPALSRAWYYAPGIQHYVRLEERETTGTAAKQTELITIRPGGQGWPPIARAALSRAVEQALETVSNGRATPWRSSGVDTRVTIKPTSRFQSGEGRLCRTFLQTWSDGQGRRSYPGAACRDDSGRWRIPGLGDGSEDELAISEELS